MPSIKPISKTRFRYFSRFTQKKFRQEQKKFIIEGVHVAEEALKSGWEIEAFLINEEHLGNDFPGKLKIPPGPGRIELFSVPPGEFNKISDTVSSQGIIGFVSEKVYKITEIMTGFGEKALIIVLDGIADPGNLGTILRACDWFGADAVFLSKNSVELFNPKVVRSTMGSLFHLPVISGIDAEDIINRARRLGFKTYAAVSAGGRSPVNFAFPGRTAVVFGNESHGVSSELTKITDGSVTIPSYGSAESLNVSVACGVVLACIRMTGEKP